MTNVEIKIYNPVRLALREVGCTCYRVLQFIKYWVFPILTFCREPNRKEKVFLNLVKTISSFEDWILSKIPRVYDILSSLTVICCPDLCCIKRKPEKAERWKKDCELINGTPRESGCRNPLMHLSFSHLSFHHRKVATTIIIC